MKPMLNIVTIDPFGEGEQLKAIREALFGAKGMVTEISCILITSKIGRFDENAHFQNIPYFYDPYVKSSKRK